MEIWKDPWDILAVKSLQQGQRVGNPPEQSWGENHTEIMEETAKNGVKIIKKGKKNPKNQWGWWHRRQK